MGEEFAGTAARIASYPGADGGILAAFSGGVDSAVVLALARRVCPDNTHAAYFSTLLHPAGELAEARALARSIGARFHVVPIDELSGAGIENNPPDRCYRCKRLMFTRLAELGESLGIHVLLDGSNADDANEFRPGLRALRELGIRSPLMEAGAGKALVRRMAAQLGLSVAGRPSAPCLATRLEYDTPLTRERLERVGAAEDFLRALGFTHVRVRDHRGVARVEVPAGDIPRAARRRGEIAAALSALGFAFVTLDMQGLSSGSMDRALTSEQKNIAADRHIK